MDSNKVAQINNKRPPESGANTKKGDDGNMPDAEVGTEPIAENVGAGEGDLSKDEAATKIQTRVRMQRDSKIVEQVRGDNETEADATGEDVGAGDGDLTEEDIPSRPLDDPYFIRIPAAQRLLADVHAQELLRDAQAINGMMEQFLTPAWGHTQLRKPSRDASADLLQTLHLSFAGQPLYAVTKREEEIQEKVQRLKAPQEMPLKVPPQDDTVVGRLKMSPLQSGASPSTRHRREHDSPREVVAPRSRTSRLDELTSAGNSRAPVRRQRASDWDRSPRANQAGGSRGLRERVSSGLRRRGTRAYHGSDLNDPGTVTNAQRIQDGPSSLRAPPIRHTASRSSQRSYASVGDGNRHMRPNMPMLKNSYEKDLHIRQHGQPHQHQHRQRDPVRLARRGQPRQHKITPTHGFRDNVGREGLYKSRRLDAYEADLHPGWQKEEHQRRQQYHERRLRDRPNGLEHKREIKHFNDGSLMPAKASLRLHNPDRHLPAREDLKAIAARSHSLVHDPQNNVYADPVMYYDHHLPQSRKHLPALR